MSQDLSTDLRELAKGDSAALDRVVRCLYDELRALARAHLRGERGGHTLQATALVNEAYLRLSREHRIGAESRSQFLAVAATTMRRILVDYARTRGRKKRGGGAIHVPLESGAIGEDDFLLSEDEADELLALEDALTRLGEVNERAAKVVEHRFFAGLSLEETGELLGVSTKTIQRDWIAARAWLRKEVARDLDLHPDSSLQNGLGDTADAES
ncbi:MAG: ECF-type sigma factor [Candidatus Eisenbacteria bacterium]